MNMIERVARALCSANPDELTPMPIVHKSSVGTQVLLKGPLEPRWKQYEPDARRAIEAMREPTEAMMRASRIVTDLPNNKPVARVTTWGANVWPNMIDVALQEK